MPRNKYLIIGASRSGLLIAERLSAEGSDVTLVSRRGAREPPGGFQHLALDASDSDALLKVAEGAATIFNCAMPAYDRWPQEFAQLASAILSAAERAGADLVTLGNIYAYGAIPERPLTESDPLLPISVKGVVRARIWDAARASRARVTEVRASDFVGKGVVSYFTWMVLPSILEGRAASFPGDVDALHSWSFTDDVVATMIAAARSEQSWGRAWHVPSINLSVRELMCRTAEVLGVKPPRLERMTLNQLAIASTDIPIMREVMEMSYQFECPCLLDSTETQSLLGVHATSVDKIVRDMAVA